MAVNLDGSLANHAFNSWRISTRHSIDYESKALAAPLLFQHAYGGDFIRTYTAVLHNNLRVLASGALCVFLTDGESIKLSQLSPPHELGDSLSI